MKKIIFLIFIIFLLLPINAYAGCSNVPYATPLWLICNPGAPVMDIPTEIETGISAINSSITVVNGYVQTGLMDVRNATAIKDAITAYQQFQQYEQTYQTVSSFAGAVYGVATGASNISNDLNNIRQLVYIPNSNNGPITPNNDLMGYINGDLNSDINILNPNATLTNTTTNSQEDQNVYSNKEAIGNEMTYLSNSDILTANANDKAANSILTDVGKTNSIADYKRAYAQAKILQLKNEDQELKNQAIFNGYLNTKINQENINTRNENNFYNYVK